MRKTTVLLTAGLLPIAPLPAAAQEPTGMSQQLNSNFSVAARARDERLKQFQQAFQRRDRGNRTLPLTAITITEDCSAEVVCPNGTKLECSIKGPSTSCHSDASGVACFKENSDGSVSGSSGSC
jgi:hypothetical protein